MTETMQIGDITITMARKDIKNVHLSVHPPSGRLTLVAPMGTRPEVARSYAASKIGWIRDQQARLLGQARETRASLPSESHYLWGRRYLLSLVEKNVKHLCNWIIAESLSRCVPAARLQSGRKSCRSGTAPCCMRWSLH